jgi:hypothetical protein
LITSGQVMTSRPFLIAVMSDSLTRSLMVAPVAYGRDRGQLVDLLLGQLVLNLGEVPS